MIGGTGRLPGLFLFPLIMEKSDVFSIEIYRSYFGRSGTVCLYGKKAQPEPGSHLAGTGRNYPGNNIFHISTK